TYVLTPHGGFENSPRDKEDLMDEFTRATRDSDDKSEVVKRGNKTKLKEGHVPSGRLREGYMHAKNEEGEFINVTDPDRFHLLRKAIELILNGTHKPIEALTVLNNDWGYTTRKTKRMGGKPMAESTWYSLLSDSKYSGTISRSEGKFDAKFPKLLTPEEAQKIQILLGKKACRERTETERLYNGEMTCGKCGGDIIMEEKWQIICSSCKGKFHKARDRFDCPYCHILIEDMNSPKLLHYVWLHCTKKKLADGKPCKQPSIAVIDFEEQVHSLIEKILIPPQFSQWAIKWLQKLHSEEVQDRTMIKKRLQERDSALQKEIDNLLDYLLRKTISEDIYKQKVDPLLLDQKQIREKLQNTDKRADDWLELCENTFNFVTYAHIWFEKGNSDQKRTILRTLGSNLVLEDRLLLIRQRKPFVIINGMQEKVGILLKTLEHGEEIDTAVQTASSDSVIPSLLPDMDSNHDERIQSPLSYH
ncbi:MAG: hypothetical protein ACREBJ_07205, partial [Nitrosotalea sp.]